MDSTLVLLEEIKMFFLSNRPVSRELDHNLDQTVSFTFPKCKVVLFVRQIKLLLKIFAPSPRR